MKLNKKMNRTGGLTIPKQMRAEMGLFPGQPVVLSLDHHGHAVIAKRDVTCRFCGTHENVIQVMGIEVCHSCGERLVSGISSEVKNAGE